ncbi:MAG: hypothetical protein ABL983_24430, partial [Nitrospira sp.]
MKHMKRYRPLLVMWLIIVGIVFAIPFMSHWAVSTWITNTPSYQLSWFVAPSKVMQPGDRLRQDQLRLRLDYLEAKKTTVARTVASAVDRYAYTRLEKNKPLEDGSFGPTPLLQGESGSVIIPVLAKSVTVPVPVKAEFAEGLLPGMLVRFENYRTPELKDGQASHIQSTTAQTNTPSANNQTGYNQPKAGIAVKKPLVVTLKAVVLSQDKKSAVLYVSIHSSDTTRVQELTRAD